MRRARAFVVVVAVVLAPRGPARARKPKPAEAAADRREPGGRTSADTVDDYLVSPGGKDAGATAAQILFRDATTAFDLGDWKRAHETLMEAYRRRPDANLLFDLGQVKNQLGDCEGAVFYYRRYLQKSPEGTNAAVAKARADMIEATSAGMPRNRSGACFTPRRPAQLRIEEDALLEPNSLRLLEPAGGSTNDEAEAFREARGRYKKGVEHYDRSRFREAALELEAAYRDFPEPEMLFDIAQAWRKAGDNDRAAANYRSFLRRVPGSPLRPFVEERLKDGAGASPAPSPKAPAAPGR